MTFSPTGHYFLFLERFDCCLRARAGFGAGQIGDLRIGIDIDIDIDIGIGIGIGFVLALDLALLVELRENEHTNEKHKQKTNPPQKNCETATQQPDHPLNS